MRTLHRPPNSKGHSLIRPPRHSIKIGFQAVRFIEINFSEFVLSLLFVCESSAVVSLYLVTISLKDVRKIFNSLVVLANSEISQPSVERSRLANVQR